jgi:type IV pilus assembly protein PilN
MIKINLIPYREERKKELIVQQSVAGALPIILLLIIMTAVWIFNTSQINSLEKETTEINKQIEACKLQMKEIDDYKSKKEEKTKKMDVIKSLTKGKDAPVHLLDELATAIPGGDVWLTSIKQKGTDLEIEGKANDNIAVSNYMVNLAKSPYLKNVDLKSIISDTGGGKGKKSVFLKTFIITCKITNPR